MNTNRRNALWTVAAGQSYQPASMASDKRYLVYILASRRHGTPYIGVTSDLIRRATEHRDGLVEGFTRRYGVKHLVYYEAFQDVRNDLIG